MVRSKKYEGNVKNLRFIQSGDGTKWLIEKEYIYPVVQNPENYRNISIDIKSIEDFVVIINEPRDKIKGKLVEKYILHGEQKKYGMGKNRNLIPAKTKTCSSRHYWCQLPDIKPSRILWQKAFDIYHRHYLVSDYVHANQRFYHIYPRDAGYIEIIVACLNSPLISLYMEFQRVAMGLGAIEATVEEVKQILIVNPKVVKASIRSRLSKALNRLGQRGVDSIFKEFGTFSPEEFTLDKVKPDRRELDKIIMGEILGLTDEEQLEVYRAVIDLVKSRIERAKSVKSNKTIEGIDMDALKNAVIERIKRE